MIMRAITTIHGRGVVLGGLLLCVLATGTKVGGFKPGRGRSSTLSFGGEVKPLAHVRFYSMFKKPSKYETDTSQGKIHHLLR
jgi:hypothetical protein